MTVSKAASKPQIQRVPAGADPDMLGQIFEDDGAAIVEGLFSADVIQRFNQELDPYAKAAVDGVHTMYNFRVPAHSKYVAGLPTISKTFRHEILNSPTLHDLCRSTFKATGDYWLTASFLRELSQGHAAQDYHRDESTHPLLRHQKPEAPPITLSIIIALTDFTEANGATRVILGSHRWPEIGTPSDDQAVRAVMKAGDVLAVRQGVVHAGGEHRGQSAQPRRAVLAYFGSCQLTPFETHMAMPRELVESMTPLAQQMIGWRSVKPALPNMSGLHTARIRLLEDELQLKSNQKLDKTV
ncbi:phytanoyl-CoA dioxygenase family protein [Aspergillus thermomutatus]|uniref:Fe2OG dioxygenase domain-containing protein n=1 Tax=Aspergillus thermomutatus TaxID=41047 RepID=A0A397GVC0_ASPTH|nr:uncharacterized protein CDV56_107176 [Aspergillus thermomutatus]RHZ53588.1 hypothetical protein CDV56_107176 [Aspergillus thermomutatus]